MHEWISSSTLEFRRPVRSTNELVARRTGEIRQALHDGCFGMEKIGTSQLPSITIFECTACSPTSMVGQQCDGCGAGKTRDNPKPKSDLGNEMKPKTSTAGLQNPVPYRVRVIMEYRMEHVSEWGQDGVFIVRSSDHLTESRSRYSGTTSF